MVISSDYLRPGSHSHFMYVSMNAENHNPSSCGIGIGPWPTVLPSRTPRCDDCAVGHHVRRDIVVAFFLAVVSAVSAVVGLGLRIWLENEDEGSRGWW